MGTGVGEAMLIGAAVGATAGGAGAAIQGGDPLKGAMMGGAMGAVGGGLGAGFGAAGGTAAGSTSGAAAGGAGGGAAGGAAGGAGASVVPGAIGSSTAAGSFGSLTGAGTGAVGGGTLGGTAAGGTFGSLGAGTGAVGGGAGFGGIGGGIGAGASTAGYVPGMYASGAASMPGGVAALPGNFTGMAPALSNARLATIGGTSLLGGLMQAERDKFGVPAEEDYVSTFDPSKFAAPNPVYAPESVYRPQYKDYTTAAEGGIMRLANGGPVERMTAMNTAINPQGGLYPQGMIDKTQYATPTQRPASMELLDTEPSYQKSNPLVTTAGMAEGGIASILEAAKAQGLTPEAYQQIYGRGNAIIEMEKRLKEGQGMARGGISSLGGYSDGGRMLKGPGDGMSDSIPGIIGGKQPARLADGEFVVPADVVSHLGNGSTDAGAKQLYSMMDKVRKARTGKKAQGKEINPRKYMPA